MSRSSFLNYIKLVNRRIFRFSSYVMFGQVSLMLGWRRNRRSGRRIKMELSSGFNMLRRLALGFKCIRTLVVLGRVHVPNMTLGWETGAVSLYCYDDDVFCCLLPCNLYSARIVHSRQNLGDPNCF